MNLSKWIPIKKPFSLPSYVKAALQRLDDAGYVAYVVGGSVRDFLLGIDSKDHDIATNANPEGICKLFPDALTVGKAFGVIKVPIPIPEKEGSQGTRLLEIATFREDLEYHDHRHPKGVRFSSPLEDARRRDFTVNGLFYDPKSSRVLDAVGGIEDLTNRVIRAIGDPQERFKEDALRLLRAVRFATRLGFSLDEKTALSIRARAKLISHVSPERIRDELTLMWTGPRPSDALELLSGLGLLRFILPELESMKGVAQSPLYHPEGDVWTHTLKIMERLAEHRRERSAALAWGTLLHDVGKPVSVRKSGGKNFNEHETEGAKIAEAIGERFRMSRSDIDRITLLVGDHLKFKDVFKMRESTLHKFLSQPHFEELLALHKADVLASDGNLAFFEFCASRFEILKKQPAGETRKLLSGNDLIQIGFQPGPQFAQILNVIEDLALDKKVKTKEEALEYVVKHFVK